MEYWQISAIVLLVCFFCQVNGDTKVTPDEAAHNTTDDLFKDSHDIRDILNSTSSNNAIVNITTDVVLSSKETLEGVENITIIGHRNPVVKCNNVGAVKFISCKNVTIEGIQWEECGSMDYPGIEIYHSSGVSFKRCSFHNSKGRSVLLSGASGKFKSCSFTHRNEYRGHGAAITFLVNTNSTSKNILLIQNSTFIFNKATQSVVYIDGSDSRITNQVYLLDSNFVNNTGVPVYISHSDLHIRGSVLFHDNTAAYGSGIYSSNSAKIYFDNCDANFISNTATTGGGAIYLVNSQLIFMTNSILTFNSNSAPSYGGAVYIYESNITFDDNSSVIFNSNKADNWGGAIYCEHLSHIKYDGNSSVNFFYNQAKYGGGAVHCEISSRITFDGNSDVKFYNNEVGDYGGALYCQSSSHIRFAGNSNVMFVHNKAQYGGAINCESSSIVTFDCDSRVTFNHNKAFLEGGAVYCESSSSIKFKGHPKANCSSDEATQYSDANCSDDNSNTTLGHDISVNFMNNTSAYGGAMTVTQSRLIFEEGSLAKFTNNIAKEGGALYLLRSVMAFEGKVNFSTNTAENGGAITFIKTSAIFAENAQLWLLKNSATRDGGAMYLSENFTVNISYNSEVTFYHNSANRHGGAIYCDLTKISESKIIFNSKHISFNCNSDLIGSDVYVDLPTSCDEMCLNDSVIINKGPGGSIGTSPRKLLFNGSEVACVNNDNNSSCQAYLTQNIMLGQEIIISAHVLDFYNQPAGPTQFILSSENQDHEIIGPDNVLISNALFEGVSIIGERISEETNYSINITSFEGIISDLRRFSIELIIELSPCHPGFHYDNATQTCVCYSDSDIVSCSGSISSIKKGYWFGKVDDKVTVTVCPNNYCNFSCCGTANGFFELSPVRVNQCNSQRSGTACGSCKKGFTLSFDSIECVSVDKCTTGQTVLVVTISILYWVVIVILVFIVTYYHIGIGYLYAITYYYSMVDILLGPDYFLSPALFTFISVISSTAKVTPQFLGQLCLVTNMSGIDQQFIHYVHPLAVAIIVIIISLSARISYKFSSFISRGIIHVICFLLLLSYTSVATTSLLLLRSLTFDNVDKVYTFLSPDIEYFHGRHLPYFLIAILCTLGIVIGLPLLLLLEPFLNHKINLTKIKPLLDQFQGCYKDKYRSFAAYYMTCRLVIILIIVLNPSNSNISQYLLIILSSLLALIHMTIRPYGSSILNLFDGFVLQLMIVVSMVPLVIIDSFSHDVLITFVVILVILPLIAFTAMEIYLYRNAIKKVITYSVKPKPDTETEIPMRDYIDSIIDDSRRTNATICEIEANDYVLYQESFMEVMDDIRD